MFGFGPVQPLRGILSPLRLISHLAHYYWIKLGKDI